MFSKAEIASQRAVLAIVAPAAEVAAPADALAAEGAEVDAAAPAFECPILLDDVAADNIVLLLAAGEAPWLVGLGARRAVGLHRRAVSYPYPPRDRQAGRGRAAGVPAGAPAG